MRGGLIIFTYKKYKKQCIFLIFFITFFVLFLRPVRAQSIGEKNVLILSSYGNQSTILSGQQSRTWTDEIISSVNSEFVDSKKNINVKMEYMGLGKSTWPQYYELYKHSFTSTTFDVVLALDDDAFNFLLSYGDKLFPNTPVVFSGVNNFNTSMISGHPLFTGLSKSLDIKNTLDVALKLQPNAKQIFVITDKAPGGVEDYIKGLIPLYKDKVTFIFSDEQNVTKVKEKMDKLPKDTIAYFDANLKDDNGKDMLITQVADILFKDNKIPSFSKCYIEVNKQSVGGVITYGTDLGKEVGKLALRILDGEKPSDIPVTEDSAHNYVFNYNKLKQFHIDLNTLPKGSWIVNQPSKFYNISKTQVLYLITAIIFIIILALVFVIANIYRRKLAEKLLFDSESVLYTVMDSTPNIIYMRSPDGKFVKANNTVLNLLGTNEKDFEDKSVDELANSSADAKYVLESWMSQDEEAWNTGTMYRSEEVIPDKKENIDRFYDTLRIPLFNDDGTRRGLILFGLDITDHKNNEENAKLIQEMIHYDKLKTNFFSNISHELRTPLNLIFSALQIIELKTSAFNEEQESVEKYIGIMRQNSYRLLRIIGNLIDITKIDAGHFFTQQSNRDIVSIAENIVLSVVDYVESKGISITFDTEIEEKIMAFDPDAIERIILNLLSNSIKFTPSGGSIEVNIYDKVNSIVISVKDTGLGIPVEKQSSIFEKFVQVDKSLSRNREGSGIGLSLVKELVVIHNGTIELESIPGKGSEFRIEIPVKLIHEDENPTESNIYTSENKVERIKIEFSDIYN
ncbi:ABC transporter substrate binding protein [Clostridium polyendosporum]|uniref:ABC transporter substrate binding protein n=1 Tax=Clostridium polyendosporum TaxID=69208 RepID=UPI001FE39ABE|nr:ABC transporter substrate binding protein [Clostridium polyendosporum]